MISKSHKVIGKVKIYKWTNLFNGKVYIGSTNDTHKRNIAHTKDAKRGVDTIFYRAIRKWGWEAFTFDVIEECCPLLRNMYENKWIHHYHTLDKSYGYNACLADHIWTNEETVQKIIQTLKGNQRAKGHKHTEEFKAEMSRRLKNNQYAKGHKHTDEYKAAVSKRTKGHKYSVGHKWTDEQKKRHSERLTGRKMSESFCLKTSERMKGNQITKGRVYGEETRAKHRGNKNSVGKVLSAKNKESLRKGSESYNIKYRHDKAENAWSKLHTLYAVCHSLINRCNTSIEESKSYVTNMSIFLCLCYIQYKYEVFYTSLRTLNNNKKKQALKNLTESSEQQTESGS